MFDLDGGVWQAALQNYEDVIAAIAASSPRKGQNFLNLHKWFNETLPEQLQKKSFLTLEELTKITDYKMMRGTFRIGLASKVKSNQESQVQQTTRTAFNHIKGLAVPEIDKVVWAMVELDKGHGGKEKRAKKGGLAGIGPATALVIMSACNESIPYFSDEAFELASGDKVTYTMKSCKILCEKLREKALELGSPWNARMCEKALFAYAHSDLVQKSKRVLTEEEEKPVKKGVAKTEPEEYIATVADEPTKKRSKR
ncbi:hypothetical protein HDU76_012998 [Blyttiomyces sp. JEL0837]|nr:hypothetical protein HDU76_012998 [Blyttiomyces sp. JEL0837]